MVAPGIAIEAAPPVWAPLRFLLTAPWFGVLAGLLLLWGGPAALESRFTPVLLGATHLLTLGFMSMAMLGALLQLMPVVAGAPLPRSSPVASVVHGLLSAGTLLLTAGLWLGSAIAIRLGTPLLVLSLAVFVAVGLVALLRAPTREAIGRTVGIALLALAVTVVLGAALAAALAWSAPVNVAKVVDLHAAWGLVGWTAILVVGVAQQVVPMFQVTPQYPRGVAVWLAPLVVLLLSGWSATAWLDGGAVGRAIVAGVALLVLVFSSYTVVLQTRSRRPKADATMLAWRAGMACLALSATVVAAAAYVEAPPARLTVLTGVLVIAGFALSVISGMLYKIVPFLLWLHLQNNVGGRVPHIRLILPDASARRHLWLHLTAVLLLGAAALWPQWLLYPAAAVFTLANATLGWTLLRACRWAAWRPESV
jgi:hypothetical protein